MNLFRIGFVPLVDAALPILESDAAISLLVGPEGGYANNEVDLIVKQGFTPISLGPRVLRMETAALAGLAR